MAQRSYRQRKRGTRWPDTDRLSLRYKRAQSKRRTPKQGPIGGLFEATGDPLVRADHALAARAYGFERAARPSARLRQIRAEIFGNELSQLADLAIWFQKCRRWSALRAAGEAVALGAERGVWLGVHAPASFEYAVERVRKAVARAQRLDHRRHEPRGWTGAMMFVRPLPGRLISLPAEPPRTRLPAEGMWVRDDSYWRRLIQDGDVIVGVGEIITQPSPTS
jgi:hypothetical protein